jgi:ABC-type Fe3+ transport system permease subunit
MTKIERILRLRQTGLVVIFACFVLIFILFLAPSVYDFFHYRKSLPQEDSVLISAWLLSFLMLAVALWRRLLLQKSVRQDSSLRQVLQDEREKFNWLRSYRVAFFFLIFIQFAVQLPSFLYPIYWVSYPEEITLSAAVMSLVGMFLIFNREGKHE